LKYQDEIHGSLLSQAVRVVDLIFTKYLKAAITYEGVTRVETYPFPKEGIREAVFNAIAHKFYGALIPIQISVYPDRLYIANTFFRAGFIEAWGRGIEKIKDSCRKSGNPMPEYTIKREDIMVMFRALVPQSNQDNQSRQQSKR